jgi:hypothetical protein
VRDDASDGTDGTSGFGPYVTRRIRTRPDGAVEYWESRWHRKHLRTAGEAGSAWWAPQDRGWWIGILFAIGSLLFALGVVPAFADAVGGRLDALTFFVGSLFFTAAGFMQYREAVDASPRSAGARRRKVFVFLPRRIDWLATGVQLVGTVEFNVSTAIAVVAPLGSPLAHHHVWRPDVIGSACFLVASALAWFEACHGWWAWSPHSAGWWTTAVNLAGSVAFGVSAVAAYVEPGTTELLSAPLTNLGTLFGAVCFFVGALLLLLERTESAPGPRQVA